MTAPSGVPPFSVIGSRQVTDVLDGHEPQVVDLVRQTYLRHAAGNTVNPPSYFLRFPDRPSARIIALPASIGAGRDGYRAAPDGFGATPDGFGADQRVDGIKWISSVPDNVGRGMPRASAVVILNDPVTGFPYACLESSVISAVRTAASAALAADVLSRNRIRPRSVGIVGTGVIARHIHEYLVRTGWDFDEVGVFDLSSSRAHRFAASLREQHRGTQVSVHPSLAAAVRGHDLVVFATVAGTPHVLDARLFAHHPLVLHVSLRDLGTEVILDAVNVVDDVDHCLRADTSVHLAEQRVGHRGFVDGILAEVLRGALVPPADRTVVFSPFGLGVLDLAVAKQVHDTLAQRDELQQVAGFFADVDRVPVA